MRTPRPARPQPRPTARRPAPLPARPSIEAAMALGMHRDPEMAEALALLELNPEDQALAELVREDMTVRLEQQLLLPNPFRMTQPSALDDVDGHLKLGVIPESGKLYGIHPDDLTTHLLVLGRTGGGKTNLLLLIALQILRWTA